MPCMKLLGKCHILAKKHRDIPNLAFTEDNIYRLEETVNPEEK